MLCVAVPYVATVALAAREGGREDAALVSGMLASAAVLAAAGLLFLRSQVTSDPHQGWLLLLATAWAVDATTRAGLRLLDPVSYDARAAWMVSLDVLVGVTAVLLLLLAQRVVLTFEPLPAGLALGLLAGCARVALELLAPPVGLPRGATVVAGVTLLGVNAAIALAVLRIPALADWARSGIAMAVVLFSLGSALTYHYPLGDVRAATTVVTNLAGSLLLVAVVGVLVLQTVRARRRELRWLRQRLLEAEARQRSESARMHEIAGTVAGIVSATRLVRGDVAISEDRRQQLDALVDGEVTRLQDLMAARHDGEPEAGRAVDLDRALYPLVMELQARGNPVQWRPSGLTAHVSAEEVSRAVTLLIDNIARHAPGSEAVVEVRRADESVEIHIADRGPGVPEEAREHLFDPVPGPAANGSSRSAAHGLETARRLVHEQGGYLRLADTPTNRGAEFVIGLPATRRSRGEGRARRGDRTALAAPRQRDGARAR